MNIFKRITNYLKKHPSEIHVLVGEGANYIDLLYATPLRLDTVFGRVVTSLQKILLAGSINAGIFITIGYAPIFLIGFLMRFHKIEAQKIAIKDVGNLKTLCRALLKINPNDKEANKFLADLTKIESLIESLKSKRVALEENQTIKAQSNKDGKDTSAIDKKINTLEADIEQLEADISQLKQPIDDQAKIFIESITSELEEEGTLPYSLDTADDKNGLPHLIIPGFANPQEKLLPSANNGLSESEYNDIEEIPLVNTRSAKKQLNKQATDDSSFSDGNILLGQVAASNGSTHNHGCLQDQLYNDKHFFGQDGVTLLSLDLTQTDTNNKHPLMDNHVSTPEPKTVHISWIKGAEAEIFKLTKKISKAKDAEEIKSLTQKAWNILTFGIEQTLSFLGDEAFYFWIIWSGVLFSQGMAATNDKVNAHIENLMAPVFAAIFRILQIRDYLIDEKAGKHTDEYKEEQKIKAKQKLIAEKIQNFFLIKRNTENDIKKFAAMKLKAEDLTVSNDLEQAVSLNDHLPKRYDGRNVITRITSKTPNTSMHSQYGISLPHLAVRSAAAGVSAYVLIQFIVWGLTTFIWLGAKFWAHNDNLADRTGIENANQTAADITFDISLVAFWIAFSLQGYTNFQAQKTLQVTADTKLSEKYPGHDRSKGKVLDELKATLEAELGIIEKLIKENQGLVKNYNQLTTGIKLQASHYIPSFEHIKAGLYSLSGYFAEKTAVEKITDFFTLQSLRNDLPDFSANFHQKTIWEKIDDYIVTRLIGNAGTGFFIFRSEDYNWQDISGGVQPYDFWKAASIGVATIALRWIDKWFESKFDTKKTLIENNLDTYKYFLEKQMRKLDAIKAVLTHNKAMLTAAVQVLTPANEKQSLLINTL